MRTVFNLQNICSPVSYQSPSSSFHAATYRKKEDQFGDWKISKDLLLDDYKAKSEKSISYLRMIKHDRLN